MHGGLRRDFQEYFKTPSKTPRPDIMTTSYADAAAAQNHSKQKKGKALAIPPSFSSSVSSSPVPTAHARSSEREDDEDSNPEGIVINEFLGGMVEEDPQNERDTLGQDSALAWLDDHVAHSGNDITGKNMTYRSRHYQPTAADRPEETDIVVPKRVSLSLLRTEPSKLHLFIHILGCHPHRSQAYELRGSRNYGTSQKSEGTEEFRWT